MTKRFFFLTTTILCFSPFHAYSADIDGCVTRSGGGAITKAAIKMMDEYENWTINITEVDNTTGCYTATGIDPGNYNIKAEPYAPSEDQQYISKEMYVTVADSGNTFDFELELGGNISGNVSLETPINTPANNPIGIEVFDQNGNYITWGWINWDEGGTYTTHAISPGEYLVKFKDTDGQFQEEWYGNIPARWNTAWSAPRVTVTADATTTNIDASLHEITESTNRYYYSNAYLLTFNTAQAGKPLQTFTWMTGDINRFSNDAVVSSDEVASFVVTKPTAAVCTGYPIRYDTWRLRFRDQNSDGLITDSNEYLGINPYSEGGGECLDDSYELEAGQYQFVTTFKNGANNGEALTKTVSLQESALNNTTELPPPTNLLSTWNNTTNELSLSWTMPTYSSALTSEMQIRLYLFKNGLDLDRQVRIDHLPTTQGMNNFTLSRDMTAPFNRSGIDQILVQVRVYGINNTISRVTEAYDFNSTTGTLTPAKIRMTFFDVNGDGKMGLAETIHTLNAVSGQ